MVNNNDLVFLSNALLFNLIDNLSLKIFHEMNIDLASIYTQYFQYEIFCRRFKFKFSKGQWFVLEVYRKYKYFTIHFFDGKHIIKGSKSKFTFEDSDSFLASWKLAEEKIMEELKK